MTAITQQAAADVRPLAGSTVQRITLGAAVTAPGPVTLQSDGKWDPTDTSTAQLTVAIPIQSGVDGQEVDAVVHGPVLALSGATIGALVYGSDTAGAYDDAAGTKSTVIGFAKSATVLFVQPNFVDLV